MDSARVRLEKNAYRAPRFKEIHEVQQPGVETVQGGRFRTLRRQVVQVARVE